MIEPFGGVIHAVVLDGQRCEHFERCDIVGVLRHPGIEQCARSGLIAGFDHCGAGGQGEFAVVVQPDMKGRGLARHLMQRLIDWGRSQGMAEIVGQVLADNQPMLAFVRRMGFSVRRTPGEEDVVEARLALQAEEAAEAAC